MRVIHGWHGTRLRWTLRRVDAFAAINKAVRRNFEKVTK